MSKTQILVSFKDVSFHERSASTTLKIPINEDDPEKHVGHVWSNYSKRRFIGSLYHGDALPNNKQIEGIPRLIVEGAFDTHKPSFSENDISLKITFEKREISADDLVKFSGAVGWLEIEEITDIPEKPKSKSKSSELWQSVTIDKLGLNNQFSKSLKEKGVDTVGDIVDVLLEESEFSLEDLDVTEARQQAIKQKLELFFEDQGTENPLLANV